MNSGPLSLTGRLAPAIIDRRVNIVVSRFWNPARDAAPEPLSEGLTLLGFPPPLRPRDSVLTTDVPHHGRPRDRDPGHGGDVHRVRPAILRQVEQRIAADQGEVPAARAMD